VAALVNILMTARLLNSDVEGALASLDEHAILPGRAGIAPETRRTFPKCAPAFFLWPDARYKIACQACDIRAEQEGTRRTRHLCQPPHVRDPLLMLCADAPYFGASQYLGRSQ
jgi:hypothetical protein